MSNGRVCQKHIESPVTIYDQCVGCELERLQQQLADRDKTIAELQHELNETLKQEKKALQIGISYKNQNALMLEALERMADTDHDDSHWYMELAEETLAKVKGGETE